MPDPKPLELPPLQKPFILSYDQGDEAYPIVAVHFDQRAGGGQNVPVSGTPAPTGDFCTGAPNYPGSYVFVGATLLQPQQRMQWVYRILPGPFTDVRRTDVDSIVMQVATRDNIDANITPAENSGGGIWTRTAAEAVTDYYSKEIVTTRVLPGNTLTTDQIGDRRLLPPKLLAVNEIKTERTKVALPASPDPLSSTVLQSTIIPETADEGILENVVGPVSWNSVSETFVDDQTWGTAGTISLSASASETVDEGILILESSVDQVGDLQVKTTTAVEAWPDLVGDTYEVPEFRDERFFQGEEITLSREKVAAGTAADIVTAPGSSSVVAPETSTRSQKDTKTRIPTYGTVLYGAVVSEATQMQVGTVTETQGTGLTADTGLLVVSSTVRALGGGYQIKSTVTVASWGTLVSTYEDEDGIPVLEQRVKVAAGTVTPSDGISGGNWIVVSEEEIDTEKSWQITRTRDATGNTVVTETRTDPDSTPVTVSKAIIAAGSAVTSDTVSGGHWILSSYRQYPKTTTVVWQMVETRACPGTAIPSTRLDPDGISVTLEKTLIVAGTGTTSDSESSGTSYTREWIEEDPRSIKVQWQRYETRAIPGNAYTPSAIEPNDEILSITRQLKATSAITTSNTANSPSTGEQTKVYIDAYEKSTVVAWQVTEVSILFTKQTYSAEVPDIFPARFVADLEATTAKSESFGTAAAPTIDPTTGDLSATSTQVTKLKVENGLTTRNVSSLPTLTGETYNRQLGIQLPYTEDVVASGTTLGNAYTSVQPLSKDFDLSKVETPPTSAYDTFIRAFPATARIELPPVLTGIDVTWETSGGSGSATALNNGDAGGPSWTIQNDIPNSSEGSGSVLPEINPIIDTFYRGNIIPTEDYFLFLASGASQATVIAALYTLASITVNPWPVYLTNPLTITLLGQKVAVRANARAATYDSENADGGYGHSASTSVGTDQDYGSTVRAVTISETIHGALTISSATNSQTATADASAQIVGTGGASSANTGTITLTSTAVGAVVPSSIAATPQTAWPTSGQYLQSIESENFQDGYIQVRARVIDFANITVPAITSALTKAVTSGVAMTYTITAGGNPLSFGASGLPSGLTINTTTGVISGTTTSSGAHNVTISATNAAGTGSAVLVITVS